MRHYPVEACDLCPDYDTCPHIEADKMIGTNCPLPDVWTEQEIAEAKRMKDDY